MNLQRLVAKCNNMLRIELGAQDGGEYAWKYSEDLRRYSRVTDDEGRPKFEFYPNPADPSGLWVAQAVYRIVPMFDHRVHCQWVLAKNVPPDITEAQWVDAFGTMAPYPANGTWIPVSPVYLDCGVEPSEAMTWAVIRAFRAQRKVKASDIDAETEAGMAKRDSDKFNTILDDIKECAPAFYANPGKKEHVSFGGVSDLLSQPNTNTQGVGQ